MKVKQQLTASEENTVCLLFTTSDNRIKTVGLSPIKHKHLAAAAAAASAFNVTVFMALPVQCPHV